MTESRHWVGGALQKWSHSSYFYITLFPSGLLVLREAVVGTRYCAAFNTIVIRRNETRNGAEERHYTHARTHVQSTPIHYTLYYGRDNELRIIETAEPCLRDSGFVASRTCAPMQVWMFTRTM